ncbi:MAG: Gfo/Idh/MocA family oxidoreductase [Paenibacillaceae bacterium]|nr:Gfo/Idh/MocA family oxidoreductase [Paenibacillaceae bacterium]
MPKVALIGLGTMGRLHAETWHNMDGVELAAVCSGSPEAARAAAARYGAAAFADIDALFADGRFDIVDICLPTALHKEAVIRAAAHGKHVVCEKPLALHEQDAREIADACESHKVRLFVGHVLRFCPEYEQARALAQGGALGSVGVVHLSRSGVYPLGSGDWYADVRRSGGLALDMLIHDLDWLLWTFGRAERVAARRVCRGDKERRVEHVSATIRMESGAIALVKGSWAYPPFETSFEIAGKEGVLVHHSGASAPLSFKKPPSSGEERRDAVSIPDIWLAEDPMTRQLAHFIACIATGKPALVTPEDAIRAIRLCEAVNLAAETGQPVDTGKELRP